MLNRFLAAQFAHPHGAPGGLLLGPLLDRIGAPMMEGAFEVLHVRHGERVLDLGFGGGMLSRRLLKAGAHVVGVDRSAAMVARARRRHLPEIRAGRAIFLEGDASALPLADSAFEKAASVNVLYFWPCLPPVMRELARVLAPGGRLVLGFQTPDQVRAWPGHVHGFTAHAAEAVEAALAGAGFRVEGHTKGHAATVGDYVLLAALRAGA
ncbi:MAG: class I SAM-dependent methyltransferase [Thermaurantiacus sp.]